MEQYSKLIFDFAKADRVDWHNGEIVATIPASEDTINFVKKLESSSVSNYQVTRDSLSVNSGRIRIGDTLKVILRPPRGQDVFFAWNLDDLLRKSSLTNKPDKVVVFEENYISWETPAPSEKLCAYLRLNEFLNELIALNVLERKVDDELRLFSSTGSMPIIARTRASVLEDNTDSILKGIQAILEIAATPLHANDKKRILRSVLFSSLKNSQKKERLNHFLKHCSEISKSYSNNYELFVSEFSFEDDYEKLMKQQEEFSSRLSAILTSIQTKILAIPVTLILAFGLMKPNQEDFPIFVNTAILAAALIFSILLWVLLSSQTKILNILNNEIDHKEERYRVDCPNIYHEVTSTFKSLKTQYTNTDRMVQFLKILIVVGFLATLFAYVYMTPQVNAALGDIFTNVVGRNVEIPDPFIVTVTPSPSLTITPMGTPSSYPTGSP